MSLDTARRAIDLALSRQPSTLELSFFGGEPLLQLELLRDATAYAQLRLAERSSRVPLLVVLNTNAMLVDQSVLDWLRMLPRVAAYVSVDGPANGAPPR